MCKLGYVVWSRRTLQYILFPAGYVGGSRWNDNSANTCPKTREIDQTGRDGKLKLGHGNSNTSFLY